MTRERASVHMRKRFRVFSYIMKQGNDGKTLKFYTYTVGGPSLSAVNNQKLLF